MHGPMTDAEATFLRTVIDATRAARPEDLQTAVSDFSSFTFAGAPGEASESFSDDFVEGLLNVVASHEFVGMSDSFHLLMLFQNDWARLKDAQQRRVAAVLAQQFDRLRDHASHLVIVELLAEYFGGKEALEMLNVLRRVSDPVARAHVAHGYGLLARSTRDQLVKREAMDSLQLLAHDSSSVVSREASVELARLQSS
jgi:hypothetical protein